MDKKSAREFSGNVLNAIQEVSKALLIAERSSSKDEMALIKNNVGHLIASIVKANIVAQALHARPKKPSASRRTHGQGGWMGG